MFVKGRLKPGVTAEQAHANVALIGRQLEAANVQTNKDRRMAAVPTEDVRLLVPQAGGILSIGAAGLMTIVGLVLLIACANVAGMLLARASARRREISVRLAIGASRGRLIQQLLVEGAMLGTLGAVAAVALAWALVQGLQGIKLPLPVDVAFDLRIDARVLTFSLIVAALTGVLAGLLPALKASAPSLVSDLRGEAPAGKVGRRRFALRDALVVSQVALTAVLLVVAGLLLRSLGASQRADVGFDPRGLAAISLDTDMVRYSQERSDVFWREALARVSALPGVQSAGLVGPTLPFTFNFSQQEMRVDSRTYPEGQRGEILENVAVSPTYLRTLGVPLVDGRDISETDIAGSPDVVVINQTMAEKFWPKQSAVGHTVRGRESDTHAHVPHRRRRVEPQAPRRARGAVADGVFRRRAANLELQVHHGAHHRQRRRAAGGDAPRAARDGAGPGLHGQHDDGAEPGHEPDAGARRRDAGDRVRRPRHAARRDRPLRRDRVLGGAPHARDRRAHGDRRQSVRQCCRW